MNDTNKRFPIGDGYKPSTKNPQKTPATGGYQPTKSTGTNPTNPQPTVTPPKKPWDIDMSDTKDSNNLNEGYTPKATPIIDDSNSKFGYQPAKSSGNNPTNQPTQTATPPKKP